MEKLSQSPYFREQHLSFRSRANTVDIGEVDTKCWRGGTCLMWDTR